MSAASNRGSTRAKRTLSSLGVLFLLALSVAFAPTVAGAEPAGLSLTPSLGDDLAGAPSDLLPNRQAPDESRRIPGQYIVVLKGSVESPATVAKAQTENQDGDLGPVYSHAIKGYAAKLSKDAVEELRQNPKVKYISPDYEVEAFSQTIPTGIARIGATENATAAIDGNDTRVDVDVAVIDTGIDYTHPDLDVYKRTNCVAPHERAEFEEETPKPCTDGVGTDGYGHGTHVAGTIGAFDNDEGVVGVAPGARLWAVRVLNNDGFGTMAWIIAGVDWVKAHAAEIEVANMSLGCGCPQPALEEAISALVSSGVVVSVAAGNSEADTQYFSPAKNPDVITVSALADYDGKAGGEAQPLTPIECKEADAESGEFNYGLDDTLARFSNWGAAVDVAAPGVCILSTLPGGSYGYESGTSMASPHVAGVAALLASKSNPNSKAAVEAIRKQITDEAGQDWTDISTYGDQKAGVEVLPYYGETSYDSTQEPLLDARLQATATYTTRASSRKLTAATLNGGINPNGTETSYQFEYGTTTSYGTKVPASPKSVGAGTKDVKASEPISGLKANTTYHYRIVSSGSKGTVYGKDKVFTTAFNFFTYPAREVEASSAKLEGKVNPSGTETSYQFEYGTTTSYGSKAPAAPKSLGSGASFVVANQTVEGLKPSTTYHYRVAITNKDGTFTGTDRSFTTPAAVTAKPATGLDVRRARLEAMVNPTGLATTYQFEWGTNKTYGSVIPASPKSAGSGSKRIRVNELLEGLKPDTDYHFRVKVTNSAGTTYGADNLFSTATTEFEPGGKSTTLVNGEPCGAGEGGCSSCAYCGALYLQTKWGFEYPASFLHTMSECDVPPLFAQITGPRESLIANPVSVECDEAAEGFGKGELKPNGCRYEFHPGYEATPGKWKGSTDIGGPECTGMTATFTNGDGLELRCKITINPQNGLYTTYEPITGANGKKRVRVTLNGKLTSYTQEGTLCPDGTYGEGPEDRAGILAVWDLVASEVAGSPLDLLLKKASATASTKDATAITASEATLNGTVNPSGLVTTYQFQYVSAAGYNPEATNPYAAGAKAPASPASAGSGSADVAVSTTVKSLGTHKTYHYRLVAENSQGATYGKDKLLTTTPELLASFGTKGSENGQLSSPKGLAVDSSGNLYVADSANNRIQKFNAKGEYLSKFGTLGSGNGQLKEPSDIAIDSNGDLWVVDKGNARVEKFNAKGEYLSQFGSYGEGEAQFKEPTDIAIDKDGDIWVIDGITWYRKEFTPNGELLRLIEGLIATPAGGVSGGPPRGMAIDQSGAFWISDFGTNRLVKLGPTWWEFSLAVGKDANYSGSGDPDLCLNSGSCQGGLKGSTYNRQFDNPRAVEVLPSGNVVVTDASRAQEISPDGSFVTTFGAGQLSGAAGIADGPGGALYIADTGNNRIQRWCIPKAPTAITQATTSVSGGKATLQGTVNPSCVATTYQFEYGTTTSYGSKVPASPLSVGSGTEDIAASQTIEGLSEHQTYHYRLVATNAEGTTYGADREFVTGGWSTQTTSNPVPYDNSYFADVSCLSATSCFAVGYDEYRGRSFVQQWNGTSWSIMSSVEASARLSDISCSGNICLLTGSEEGKALTWKLGKLAGIWGLFTPLTTPTPEGASSVVLGDVACSAETACTAVGSSSLGTLAMRWNGSAWAIQTTANPSGGEGSAGQLLSVSCPSSTSCTAVGTRSSSGTQTFSERWNGTSWSIASVPKPAGALEGALEDVSCATTSACMAVGWFKESTGATPRKGLAVSWNGSAWAVTSTPAPAGAENGVTLSGVSCTAANACTAVGRTGGVSLAFMSESTLAETWNGSAWSIQTTVNPLAYSRLSAVSCTAANACTAVGKKRPESGDAGTQTLAERWNGSSWSAQTTPNRVPYDFSQLEDTSCLSATDCMAVGNDEYKGTGLVQYWDGTSWSFLQNVGNAYFSGVSCKGEACLITGNWRGGAVQTWKMQKAFGGKGWAVSTLTTPTPGGASSVVLEDISCSAETACTAVGSSSLGTLAMRWNGSAWAIQTTANQGIASKLLSVSCPSSTSCTAVGTRPSSGTQTFSERWNGTGWSIGSVPNPAGLVEGALEDVSCATTSACMAVGWFKESTLNTTPRKSLAVSWNGSAWSVTSTPTPAGAENGVTLSGVSCTTANACTAVGRTGGVSPVFMSESTLAEVWNGSAWSIQTTVNPLAYSRLSAVSCTAANACTAVGKKRPESGNPGTLTLAERWG